MRQSDWKDYNQAQYKGADLRWSASKVLPSAGYEKGLIARDDARCKRPEIHQTRKCTYKSHKTNAWCIWWIFRDSMYLTKLQTKHTWWDTTSGQAIQSMAVATVVIHQAKRIDPDHEPEQYSHTATWRWRSRGLDRARVLMDDQYLSWGHHHRPDITVHNLKNI